MLLPLEAMQREFQEIESADTVRTKIICTELPIANIGSSAQE